MTSGPKLDVSELPLDQLLDGLTTDAPREANPIDIWIENNSLYPGSTRVQAKVLYAEYVDYIEKEKLGRPAAIRVWGKYMTSKFKTGRGKAGIFYYVSRERDVEIPTSLKTGGVGMGGRGDPVP